MGLAGAGAQGQMASPASRRRCWACRSSPGERGVVYFFKPSYSGDKAALWIVGVLTVWMLIGIIFIVLAVTFDSRNPKAQVVTNMRVIEINGKGIPTWIPGRRRSISPPSARRATPRAAGSSAWPSAPP